MSVKNTINGFKGLSEHRQSEIRNGEQGRVESGNYKGKNFDNLTDASNVSVAYGSPTGIKKSAQVASTGIGSGGGYAGQWSSQGGGGNTVRQVPEVYSPLWLNSNINFPRDRATINSWCRSFYALNPVVQNAINLHSTYPISKLTIKCPNKKVESFFNDMIEEIDLLNICIQVAQEYHLLGEAFVHAELDERNAKWSRLVIQNPDYIVVKPSAIASEPIIMMRADENLKRIALSNKPSDIEQRNQLPENIIQHIRRGENIPLDNFYISHLARRISPYEVRGTGLPVCVFRNLMLFDIIREAKFAQAHNMINPITLIKIGSADFKPTPADIEAWRNAWSETQYDRDAKIFTHEAVTVEKIGNNSAIVDTSADITQLLKEIYIGLMVPQVIMDGGGDITYQNGGVSLDVLRQRYMSFRNLMTSWLKRKIFAPISRINEFYEYVDGEKTLIVPDIDWNHMSLFDAGDYITALSGLVTGDTKKVSIHSLYRSLGLEYDEEQRKIRKEDIADAIRKKEQASLEKMPLNELRSLDDDNEIPEILESALPGESPYDGSDGGASSGGDHSGGGAPPGGGLPGLDLSPPPPPSPPAPSGGKP